MRIRAVPILLIAGLCCLLAAVLLPGVANADAQQGVEVSVAGGSFTSYSSRPLLDVSALAPGDTTAAVMGVRSTMRSAGVLYLRMHGVHDDDNGCVRPERRVDTTCGRGDGDLGQQLRFTVATAAREHGSYTARWSGTAAGLMSTINTHLEHRVERDALGPDDRGAAGQRRPPGRVGHVPVRARRDRAREGRHRWCGDRREAHPSPRNVRRWDHRSRTPAWP